jgi:hypothetical protein
MARSPQQADPDPDVADELRRRDPPTPDAPAVVPHPEDGSNRAAAGRRRMAASRSTRSTTRIRKTSAPRTMRN